MSASASIAVHLAARGYAVRLVDADGTVLRASGTAAEALSGTEARGPLLDTFATVGFTSGETQGLRDPAVRARVRDGLVVAVLGDLDLDAAEDIASLRGGHASALALVLDTSGWATRSTTPEDGRCTRVAALLAAAGWRVAVCGAQTDLVEAWQSLARAGVTAAGAR